MNLVFGKYCTIQHMPQCYIDTFISTLNKGNLDDSQLTKTNMIYLLNIKRKNNKRKCSNSFHVLTTRAPNSNAIPSQLVLNQVHFGSMMTPSTKLRTQVQPSPQFTDVLILQKPGQTQLLFFSLESIPCISTLTCLPGGEV